MQEVTERKRQREGERERGERAGYEQSSVSTYIQSKWETDLKFSRQMTLVISNSERLIILITISSAPVGNALSILLLFLPPISLRREFSSLNVRPTPPGPKGQKYFWRCICACTSALALETCHVHVWFRVSLHQGGTASGIWIGESGMQLPFSSLSLNQCLNLSTLSAICSKGRDAS